MARAVRWIAIGVACLAVLVAVGGWWLVSSRTALEWAMARAVAASNGALTLEGVDGSLLTVIRVRRLTYDTGEARLTVDGIALQLSAIALARGRVVLDTVTAAALEWQSRSTSPASPPASLALPIEVAVHQATLARVSFKDQILRDVSFAYEGGGLGHVIHALSALSDYGKIGIDGRIAGASPYALSANASLTRDDSSVRAQLGGNLLETIVTADGTMRNAHATVHARIAPFEPVWLQEADAAANNIDLAAFAANLPATDLQVKLTGAGDSNGFPSGNLHVLNKKAGTIAAGRLPVTALSGKYALENATTLLLTSLQIELGAGGTVSGKARLTEKLAEIDFIVRSLDLHALHAPLRATRLNGSGKARIAGTEQHVIANIADGAIKLGFDATRRGDVVKVKEFRAAAGPGQINGSGEVALNGNKKYSVAAVFTRLDPSAFGAYPPAVLNGEVKLAGMLAPEWQAQASLALHDSVFRGVKLAGGGTANVSPGAVHDINVGLTAGANSLRVQGGSGRPTDALTFTLDAKRLAQLDPRMSGALTANGRISGDLKHPEFNIDAAGSMLTWERGRSVAALRAHLAGNFAHHTASIQAKGNEFDLTGRLEGAWDAQRGWSGVLSSFENAGTYPVALKAPMPLAYGRERLTAGPAEVAVAGGTLSLSALSWQNGRLDTRGELKGVPAAPLLALAGTPAPGTTLRIGGSWSIAANPQLNGHISLAREAGDITLPAPANLALGLERMQLETRIVNDAVDATLDVAAQLLSGHINANTSALSADAALKVDGKVDVASLAVLDAFTGTQALVRGRASMTIAGTGTVASPRIAGSIEASALSVEAPQYGLRLRDGSLRAELTPSALTLNQLVIHGDQGVLTASGSMAFDADGETNLAWRAEHLTLLNRPDTRLKVDGSGTARLAQKKLVLRGTLSADEGYFQFDRPKLPKLGSDVVVLGRKPDPARSANPVSFQSALLDIDMTLDAGNRMQIVGAGLETELRGKLQVTTNKSGTLEARGVLSSLHGVYFAFGQRLEIERGRLIFDGPIDNPGLDIVAKRKNLAVDVGVEITGSVRIPNVKLTSDPPLPDSDKLAWLVLGHNLQTSSPADLIILQSAASALIGAGDSLPLTQRIANKIGLDEMTLRGSGEAGSQVAAFGKRLSDKLYLEYQQGLAATSAALRLSYALTRSLSVRLQAGFSNSVGLFFSRSYR